MFCLSSPRIIGTGRKLCSPTNRQTKLLRQQAKYHRCCYWLVLMKGREGKVSLSHAAAVWQKSLSSFCKIFAMGKLDQWVTMQHIKHFLPHIHSYHTIPLWNIQYYPEYQKGSKKSKAGKTERIVRYRNTAKTNLCRPAS